MRKVRQIDPPEQESPAPATVSIIDYGEGSIAPGRQPLLPRRVSELWARRSPQTRRLIVLALAGLLVVVGLGGYFTSRTLLAAPSPSSSATVIAANGSAFPNGSALASGGFPGNISDPSEGTILPIVPHTSPHASLVTGTSTWPVSVPTTVSGDPVTFSAVGPDGTLYATGGRVPPIDAAGRSRTNWARLGDGSYLTPSAFGSDGSMYGLGPETGDQKTIFAYGPNRQLRYEVATRSVLAPILIPGPASTLYLVIYDQDWPNGSPGVPPVLVVLDPQGRVSARWRLPGLPLGPVTAPQIVVRSDGDILAGYIGNDGCGLHVLSKDGDVLGSPAASCWDNLTSGPDGTLLAWSYDPVNTQGGLLVRETRLALLDQSANPMPGWPVTLAGATSTPVVGLDGRLYVNDTFSWSQSGQVVALDRSGRVASGWPVALSEAALDFSTDYPPGIPDPPVVTPTGDVFVYSTTSVAGYDRNGNSLAGWPVAAPDGWSPPLRPGVGFTRAPIFYSPIGGGRLYAALPDRIVALTLSGQIVAGWPYSPAGGSQVYWYNWAAMPNDGLLLITGSDTVYEIVVLGPDGSVAGSSTG